MAPRTYRTRVVQLLDPLYRDLGAAGSHLAIGRQSIPMSGPRAIDAPVCFEVERTLTAESGMDAALAALDCALAERRFALSRLSAPQAILNGLSIEALRADLVPDGPCRWRLTIGVDETLIVESHEEDLQ